MPFDYKTREKELARKRSNSEKAISTTNEEVNIKSSSDDIHHVAKTGVQGVGEKLPYLEQIQQYFGHYDIGNIQSYSGKKAADASEAIGAEGYAIGNKVAFSGHPSLHTAAHEAAHIIQQQQGVKLKGGVGEEGDIYERNANAAADAVVKGQPAESILSQFNSTPFSASSTNSLSMNSDSKKDAVQCYITSKGKKVGLEQAANLINLRGNISRNWSMNLAKHFAQLGGGPYSISYIVNSWDRSENQLRQEIEDRNRVRQNNYTRSRYIPEHRSYINHHFQNSDAAGASDTNSNTASWARVLPFDADEKYEDFQEEKQQISGAKLQSKKAPWAVEKEDYIHDKRLFDKYWIVTKAPSTNEEHYINGLFEEMERNPLGQKLAAAARRTCIQNDNRPLNFIYGIPGQSNGKDFTIGGTWSEETPYLAAVRIKPTSEFASLRKPAWISLAHEMIHWVRETWSEEEQDRADLEMGIGSSIPSKGALANWTNTEEARTVAFARDVGNPRLRGITENKILASVRLPMRVGYEGAFHAVLLRFLDENNQFSSDQVINMFKLFDNDVRGDFIRSVNNADEKEIERLKIEDLTLEWTLTKNKLLNVKSEEELKREELDSRQRFDNFKKRRKKIKQNPWKTQRKKVGVVNDVDLTTKKRKEFNQFLEAESLGGEDLNAHREISNLYNSSSDENKKQAEKLFKVASARWLKWSPKK